MLEGLAAARDLRIRWLEFDRGAGPTAEALADAITDDTALVTFSHVSYRSAHIAESADINALAHDAGALTLWDLSHSVGSVPLALDADGTDLAVGCTYKYLHGGPGAPAFMYVRRELQPRLRQPIWGWLGRHDPFAMGPGYAPAAGMRSFLSGTPPVIALAAVDAGVELVAEAGIDAHPDQGDCAHRVRDRARRRPAGWSRRDRGVAASGGAPRRPRCARSPRRGVLDRPADRRAAWSRTSAARMSSGSASAR